MLLNAFETSAEADLVETLRDTDAYIPALALVACERAVDVAGGGADKGEHIVGHLLMTRCRAGGLPALALAPMAVLPAHQRRGIGTRLVEHALAAARGLGEFLIIVLGHADYYPRFGFRPARPMGIMPPWDVPDEVWMAMWLGEEREIEGVVEYAEPFGRL